MYNILIYIRKLRQTFVVFLSSSSANCSAWMADKCGVRDYGDHTMLMTPKCSQHTGRCDEARKRPFCAVLC